jgi:hypothetical protein
MSDNDVIYGKGILDNLHDEYIHEYVWENHRQIKKQTEWKPPQEPQLTYFEEHVLRLLDDILQLLKNINEKI